MLNYRRCFAAFVLLVVCLTPAQSFAWGNQGHMMVAYVAYHLLNPAARARADALIALNPEFNTWKTLIPASVPAADRPAMLFMIAATWPDRIKSESAFRDDGTDNGNRPDGPPSSQNTGYGDTLRHKYWHFVDDPFSTDGTPVPPVPVPNAQERIHLFRQVIASASQPDPLKSYDLVWLLHIIGDVHQPLHDSTRVRKAQPGGDSGGNLVTVCADHACTAGGTKEALHHFWDDVVGGDVPVTAAASAAMLLKPADPAAAALLDEATWILEDFALAKGTVYQPPVGKLGGPYSLTTHYKTTALALAQKQIALAGARLANVLNAELK
jgi:hypothetical protein